MFDEANETNEQSLPLVLISRGSVSPVKLPAPEISSGRYADAAWAHRRWMLPREFSLITTKAPRAAGDLITTRGFSIWQQLREVWGSFCEQVFSML